MNNLLINSVQAMPDGGLIRIIINQIEVSDDFTLPLENGKYIKISVIDEGVGILKENQNRIFEPYFTTKSTGSGLGLAASYSIIQQHNGYIDFTSQAGNGTSFYVYIPVSSKSIEDVPPSGKIVENFRGKLLLLDDDPTIQRTLSLILMKLGFQVEIAKDGHEAISKYSKAFKSNNQFTLVIMDLTIPGGMGGKEAIEKLKELDSDVKAIVSSGYSNDPIMANYKKYGFCGVLSKPYTVNQLKTLLQQLL
jgi:CheY-like chemotaxis protein